ncbi:MAG: HAMP domain-containing histidine kinase [bacterium]|nr:HAMP domain-containing histidine kinase [bacterium]
MESSAAALEAAFEAEERERCRQGALTGALAGLPAMAAFALYDFTFFPDKAHTFLVLRLLVVVGAAVAIAFLRRPAGACYARPLAFAVFLLVGMTVVAMTVATGGRASPYYGGINIVLLAATLVMPWTPGWSAAASGSLIAAYVAGVMATSASADPRMLVHNLAFLGSTAVIAFLSTVFQRRVRWREFRTRTQLQAALAHKRDFLASMSHELRSPLHVIVGYAGMLLEEAGAVPDPEPRRLVERIRERGVFLHGMISDLLDLSKVDAGRMEIRIAPVAVDALARRVASVFAPLAAQKGVTLRAHVPAGLPAVASDPLRLEQILSNFAGNAVKFTPQGEIAIEVRALRTTATLEAEGFRVLADATAVPLRGPALAIAVRDTGIGIRHEDLARLAEDFRQLDGAARGEYGGTGLGLSIARRLASLLGGWIGVRSRYGAGTTFVLVLPIDADALRAVA